MNHVTKNCIASPSISSTQVITCTDTQMIFMGEQPLANIHLANNNGKLTWVATQELSDREGQQQFVYHHCLDNFLYTLLHSERHTNKVVELDNSLLVALKYLRIQDKKIRVSQLYFVITDSLFWSLQATDEPKLTDVVQKFNSQQKPPKKPLPQLLFFLMSSIIDSYEQVYQHVTEHDLLTHSTQEQTQNTVHLIEKKKRELISLKTTISGLRNVMTHLQKTAHHAVKHKYFNELQAQANHLISDIDFDVQELDSQLNLLLSQQSNQLNQTMQVLTVISIIFLPLNLIAGIYGMNFINMPALKTHDGYFVTLGAMVIIAVSIGVYLKWKKWF